MKTLAKFLFCLSLFAGLTACDDDAPTTGEIVLDIEKYMYVQSISIYTELGNKIYENREYLYEGGRLSIPLNPGNYRISTYGYSDCTFQIQGTRRGSTTTSTGTESSPTTDERPAHPQPRRGRYAIAGAPPPIYTGRHLLRTHRLPDPRRHSCSARQKTNKFALHSA